MLTVLFAVTTTICAIGWLKRYVSCAALIHYMNKIGCKPPSDQDLTESTQFVVKNIFRK